jgi:hypothetical protein
MYWVCSRLAGSDREKQSVFVVTTDSLGENTELGVGACDLADGIDEGSSPHGAVLKE